MLNQANEVVRANKLSDTVIVLHGRIEVCFLSKVNILSSKVSNFYCGNTELKYGLCAVAKEVVHAFTVCLFENLIAIAH